MKTLYYDRRAAPGQPLLEPFNRRDTEVKGLIDNLYPILRQLFVPVIHQFILKHLAQSIAA